MSIFLLYFIINPFLEKILFLEINQISNSSIILFQEALHIIADDGPSQTYLHRCQKYKKNPPPPDWDGVRELKTK